jgi:hypothetical protein
MGSENCHLHEFIVGGLRYGIPDPTYDEPGEVIAEDKVCLSDVLGTRSKCREFRGIIQFH